MISLNLSPLSTLCTLQTITYKKSIFYISFLLGKNVFTLIDQGIAPSIFWIMTFEILVACWLYGAWNVGNILNIISPQTPFVIQKILVFLWYITLFFLIINIESYSLFTPYGFPDWTYGYSVFLYLVPIIPLPMWGIFQFLYYMWNTEKKVCIRLFMEG